MRLPDLYDNLHTVLRSYKIITMSGQHRNKYCLKRVEVADHGFSGISKNLLKKNSVMESSFINVAKRRI